MILEADISVSYGKRKILKNVGLTLDQGEILGITGKNGSGKSTLCLALSALLPEDAAFTGKVTVFGKDFYALSRAEKCEYIGIIFQDPDTQLFSLCVEDELAFAPENLCLPREEIESRIQEALDICGIGHLRRSKINTLSGGEKQLTAIAAVLTIRPKILIADEITSRIDKDGRVRIRECLLNYVNNGGSVIMVAHSQEDKAVCSRLITLNGEDK